MTSGQLIIRTALLTLWLASGAARDGIPLDDKLYQELRAFAR